MRVLGADDIATMYTKMPLNQMLTIEIGVSGKLFAESQTKAAFDASYKQGVNNAQIANLAERFAGIASKETRVVCTSVAENPEWITRNGIATVLQSKALVL